MPLSFCRCKSLRFVKIDFVGITIQSLYFVLCLGLHKCVYFCHAPSTRSRAQVGICKSYLKNPHPWGQFHCCKYPIALYRDSKNEIYKHIPLPWGQIMLKNHYKSPPVELYPASLTQSIHTTRCTISLYIMNLNMAYRRLHGT